MVSNENLNLEDERGRVGGRRCGEEDLDDECCFRWCAWTMEGTNECLCYNVPLVLTNHLKVLYGPYGVILVHVIMAVLHQSVGESELFLANALMHVP